MSTRAQWITVGIVCAVALNPVISAAADFRRENIIAVNEEADLNNQEKPNNEKSKSSEKKGKEIFRSTHFLTGEISEKIPAIEEMRKQENFDVKANDALAQEVIQNIAEKDPEYFVQYKNEMTSGNPVRVQAAIDQGQKEIREYLQEAYPESTANMKPQACSIGVGGCIWTVALAWNYGAAVNVGAAVMVYVAFWGPNKTWSPVAGGEDPALKRQMIIAEMTDRLKYL